MTTEPRIVGTTVQFLRAEGREVPDFDDDSQFIDFGAIVDTDVEREGEAKEVWGPFTGGGRIELYDVVETKRGMIWSFIAQELSPLALETLFGSIALDELTEDFYALAGLTKKGWLLIHRYDHNDELIVIERAYVHLVVSGPVRMDADIASVPFEAQMLTKVESTIQGAPGAMWWNPETGTPWWNPAAESPVWNPDV